MKRKSMQLSALLLAMLMLLSCLAGCGDSQENSDGTDTSNNGTSEAETNDIIEDALNELGDINWGNDTFTILHSGSFVNEVWGESTFDSEKGDSQVINDAVYQRNMVLEDKYSLKFDHISKDPAAVETDIRNQASAPNGDFYMIDHSIGGLCNLSLQGYLYNMLTIGDNGINIDQPWWDTGTADFCLEDSVFFMTGDATFGDDNVTYVLIFNKEMQRRYSNTVPNPYDTVKAWDWTLDYFNQVIQGVSSDSSGDGKWDELDTYGFITTWEYGNTFFIGSDLRYIINDRENDPYLALEDTSKMDKALRVLDLAQAIYHDNNATFMSPPGEEAKGLTAFKEGRGMFYAEVAAYLRSLNADMDSDYGILPVPKFDHAQEFYRTWTFSSGSAVAMTAGIKPDNAERVASTFEAYAILSAKYVKPAFYEIMLTSRSVRDAESGEMLDIIFQNRIYDMGFFFHDFGFYTLFKEAVNSNKDNFNSNYASKTRQFDKKLQKLVKTLTKLKDQQ